MQLYYRYLKDLLVLAFPMIIGNLGQILIGAVDVFVASRHSLDTLAAISIANAIAFCIYIVGIGLMAAISIVLSNYRGDRKPTKKYLFSIVNFSLLLSVIFWVITVSTLPLIPVMGFETHLVPMIKDYIWISSFSIFGMYVYQSLKEFLQAHEIVNFPNILLIAALVVNLILNFVLVFGFMGIPALGVIGLAIATLIVRTLMGLILFIFCLRLIDFRKRFDVILIKQLVKVGYPIGFALLLEFLGFNIITILVGRESGLFASVHTIVSTVGSICYMIPLSLSNALAIKVGFFNGARIYDQIKKYSIAGVVISVAFMGLCTIMLLSFPQQIFAVFTNNVDVLAVGVPVLIIAACFEMFDGLQTSLSGVLKGLKMTKTVSACIISGYWVFGLPFGFWLAYGLNLQLKGFWLGLACSFLAIGIIEAVIIVFKFKRLRLLYSR